jgi:hypothetical protein
MLPWMLGHIYMDGDLVRRWKDFAATQNPAPVARTRLLSMLQPPWRTSS